MAKTKKYKKLLRKAIKHGWTIPRNDVFSDETWSGYWSAMNQYMLGKSEGRPIAPHRSGR